MIDGFKVNKNMKKGFLWEMGFLKVTYLGSEPSLFSPVCINTLKEFTFNVDDL